MLGRFQKAIVPAGWHFLASAVVALVVSVLVFAVWFPGPFSELSAGRELFILFVAVAFVCGPILTLVLFDARKSKRELRSDFAVVLAVQCAAVAFALWTIALARPVYLVFEVDRFQVVTAAEVDVGDLHLAPVGLQELSWRGPVVIGVRGLSDKEELLESVSQSIDGIEPSARPNWWQSYPKSVSAVLQRAKPLQALGGRGTSTALLLAEAVKRAGLPADELVWLPLTGARTKEWIVLLDKASGQPVSYAAIDGFV